MSSGKPFFADTGLGMGHIQADALSSTRSGNATGAVWRRKDAFAAGPDLCTKPESAHTKLISSSHPPWLND